MLAPLLPPFAALNAYLLTPLHATYYPYPLATTLHAARVSFIYRTIRHRRRLAADAQNKAEGKGPIEPIRSILYDAAGFLIMAWGGGFVCAYMLGIVPAQLLTFGAVLNYLSVHFFVLFLFHVVPFPPAPLVDVVLPWLDGSLRTNAVLAGINMVVSHPTSASIRASLPLQLLAGTVAANGGGQLAFTLDVFSPTGWSLKTPPFLLARSLLEATDIWAALLASSAYSLLTFSHPQWSTLLLRVNAGTVAPILSANGGRALVSFIISSAFAWRAAVVYLGSSKQPTPTTTTKEEKRAVAGAKRAGVAAAKTK